MAVASAAKMVLLSGSLLDSWRQVVSPFWKWWLMTAAAPTLVHFGAISVDFIMWSLCFTKLIELSLGFLSGDHAFTYSFNEVVSLGIIVMRSWWKVGCPQGPDQFGIDFCRGHDFLYFETNGRGRGSGHASSSSWPGSIHISSGSVEFVQGMMCWIVNASTSFHIVMHGQL